LDENDWNSSSDDGDNFPILNTGYMGPTSAPGVDMDDDEDEDEEIKY
jgi:hypothetical protein